MLTFNFRDASNRRNIHELVHQSLSVHLGQYSSLIVIPQSSAHGLVVHVRLVLMKSPQSGDRLTVHQLEDSLLSVAPLYKLWTAIFVLNIYIYLVLWDRSQRGTTCSSFSRNSHR